MAVFDSGVGGLTVYSKLKKILPGEDYIYFGDLKNSPYGQKSVEQLIKLSADIFNFFQTQEVKAVVMACNTTSATVYDYYRGKFDFKIYPIIQSSASIISKLPAKRIGVFATSATVSTQAYKREISKLNPGMEVFEMACPAWVPIVENNKQNDPLSIQLVEDQLNLMLANNPDKIILGCTHYPFLLDILTRFAPRELFIDPSEYFANYIKIDMAAENLINTEGGSEKIYVSASPKDFQDAAKMFYELNTLPELIEFDRA